MTGYIVAGKNNGGYKYGGIAENRQILRAIIKRTKVLHLWVLFIAYHKN